MSLDARVRDLTLAQQHIIEIAGAIASKPKVLFLDEPTEPFQQADVDKLFELIRQLREEEVAIVYVSHRLHEIEQLADHITVLRDGQSIDSRPAARITTGEIITMIAGRPLDQVFPAQDAKPRRAQARGQGSFRRPASRGSIFPPTPARLSV